MKYKIEVSVRDAGKALEIIRDNPFLKKKINEEASNSYSTTSRESAEELHESLKQAGVEIISSNVYAGNGAKINDLDQWWYSLPGSTREYLFIDDRDTSWDVDDSDRVWEGLSESKKTEIRTAIERNPGDEISVKYALDLPGKYRSGYYLEKEIIQNQYDGKTPEQVWNAWTEDQREHFLADHNDDWFSYNEKNGENLEMWANLYNKPFSSLPKEAVHILAHHIGGGQYGKGGEVEAIKVGDEVIPLAGEYSGEICRVFGVYPDHNQVDIMPVSTLDPRMANYHNMRHYKLNEVQKASKGTKIPIQVKGGLNGRQILVDLEDGNDPRLVKITESWFDNDRNNNLKIKNDEWDLTLTFNESYFSDFINGEKINATNKHGQKYKIMLLQNQFGKGTKITMPRMEPEELTDVLYSKENNWADIGQAQMYVYQTPSVSDYLKRLHIIDLTGQSASKIKYPDGVYVFIAKVGNRYYYVNTEGYDYARYAVEIPGWFAREINMEKAAKGTKIENMENKNYYYLKIGNRIIETFGGFSMTGSTKGGQYIYEIIGHNPTGIMVREHTITKSKKTEPFEISFYDLTKYMNAEAKGYQVEGCPMENMRDEALLDMEIADIKNSFKIEEEKAEVRKKEAEVSQAKHEADVLLKKATDTEAAAKDTIEAMEALVTKEHKDSEWQDGQVGPYKFQAKVYETGSEYGIEGGRVSKLHIKDASGKTILNYDRGWDIKPKTSEHRKLVNKILNLYPEPSSQAGKGKKVGKSYTVSIVPLNTSDDVSVSDVIYILTVEDDDTFEDVVHKDFKSKKEAEAYLKTTKYYKYYKQQAGKGKKVGELDLEKYAIEYLIGEKITKHHAESNNYMYQKPGKTKWFSIPVSDVKETIDKHGESLALEKGKTTKASKGTKVSDKKLFKKEAKVGNYYHFRLNNPKGVKKCAVPSWASDLAGSVYEGAKITTCQKDGEWFAQNVMIPTKNISKLQARSYAQQIALKIKK